MFSELVTLVKLINYSLQLNKKKRKKYSNNVSLRNVGDIFRCKEKRCKIPEVKGKKTGHEVPV